MRLLCETVVKDILPAVRSLIAKDLQEKGYTQTEISDLLGITQPAVSQYLSRARGAKVQRIEQDGAASGEVAELVDLLLADAADEELSAKFCEVCASIRERGLVDASFDDSEDLEGMCDLSP